MQLDKYTSGVGDVSTAVDDIMVIGDDVSVEVNGDVSVSVLVSIDVSGEDDDISFVVISSVVTEIVVSASESD